VQRLVVVLPLTEGAHEQARALLADGPPFDLGETQYVRHEVFLTTDEVVFVFEAGDDAPATLSIRAEDPSVWRAAAAWRPLMADRPRKAETVFAWEREDGPDGT
jgi:hypothetical protein